MVSEIKRTVTEGAGVGARSTEHSHPCPVQRSMSPSSSKQESLTVKLRQQSCRGASSAWFVHVLQPPTLHRPNQWLITGAGSVSLLSATRRRQSEVVRAGRS